MTTKVFLSRSPSSALGVFGVLSMGGAPLCVTVERPWLNNRTNVSCIPPGTYRFSKYRSPTKGYVWMATGVPGRTNIEMHAANVPADLEGCIGVGQNFQYFHGVIGVANSQTVLEELRGLLPDEFDLVITSA